MTAARALVFGGTGVVGSAVLAELRLRGTTATFTYHRSAAEAQRLSEELAHDAIQVDLKDGLAVREVVARAGPVDAFVHCAGVASVKPLDEISDADWDDLEAINVRAAFIAVRELLSRMSQGGQLEVVLVGSVDVLRPTDSPAHFGASQGALCGLARALAKNLGPRGVRTNLVVAGPIGRGISAELSAARRESYAAHSARRRLASPADVARVIGWLVCENTYANGAVVPVTGGI